jgi:hypothetical protein
MKPAQRFDPQDRTLQHSRPRCQVVMSLIEKLNLSGKPLAERIATFNAEKAKIRAITGGLGCDEDEYGDMLAHEIAEMVLIEIEKVPKPGSLHELHGGAASWWKPFGSKEKLVEFLALFRVSRGAPHHDRLAEP